jgi:hypothetical protein
MKTPVNQSEVARLRAQIEREYAAACAGLYGLSAGSARHDFIQRRMANAQEYGEQLIERIGKEAAMPLIVKAMEAGARQEQDEQVKDKHASLFSSGMG